jgi:aquaglyceroporin related protein
MATVPQPCSSSECSNETTNTYREYEHRGPTNQDPDLTQESNPTSNERNSYPSVNNASRRKISLPDPRRALGLHPKAPLSEDSDLAERRKLRWSRIRATLREPFVEFWGVVIMVAFGNGAMAQVLLSAGQTTAPGGNGYGSYQNVNWG